MGKLLSGLKVIFLGSMLMLLIAYPSSWAAEQSSNGARPSSAVQATKTITHRVARPSVRVATRSGVSPLVCRGLGCPGYLVVGVAF
jgi:hypothetical protein